MSEIFSNGTKNHMQRNKQTNKQNKQTNEKTNKHSCDTGPWTLLSHLKDRPNFVAFYDEQ